ncbi:MAG: hypothetical protein HWE27_13880 [Gammaproteobacteria bacterium]|nr:hypothetical protein [Gammaproteobacteria bacterium]
MILITICPIAYAKDSKSDYKAIENLFDSYMNKYNRYIKDRKLPKEPELYLDSIMLMSSSNSATVISSDDFNVQVTSFLDSLINQGVTYVTWESKDIKFLDKNIAVVSNIAIRYKGNGDVYNRVGATYFVNKLSNEWRIAAFAVHSPNFTGSL